MMRVENCAIDGLKYMEGNRVINEKHVKELKQAIQKNNLLHLRPVIINKHKEVIDGQHRIEACKELGMKTIPAIVLDINASLDDVQTINRHSRGWSIMDYARSYAKQGKQDYIELVDFVERTGVLPTVAVGLLGSKGGLHGGCQTASLRAGSFKVKGKRWAESYVEQLEAFKAAAPVFYRTMQFSNAFSVVKRTPGYDHDRMMKKLGNQRIRKATNARDYLEQLTEIYNYYEKAEAKLIFSFADRS